MTEYAWAVVGAGPAGITAVGKLIDGGADPATIAWIDPEFKVGDLGRLWQNVSSNTKVNLFIAHLKATAAFDYDTNCAGCSLESLDPDDTCQLSHAVAPLQVVSDALVKRVKPVHARVDRVARDGNCWQLHCDNGDLLAADRVILAVGAEPKSLDYDTAVMPLALALNPERVKHEVNPDQTVAVFGASHSAVLVMKNLLERGCKVVNFYHGDLRYAIYHDDWIEFDNTGLKGLAAHWAKQNLDSAAGFPGLTRVPSDAEHIAEYLPTCQSVVYAVGFSPRGIDGVDASQYNTSTGEIAPGMYGFGIACPERVTDRAGHKEFSVGLWKFNNYVERVIPMWMAAATESV